MIGCSTVQDSLEILTCQMTDLVRNQEIENLSLFLNARERKGLVESLVHVQHGTPGL